MIRLRSTHTTVNGDKFTIFIYDRELGASTYDTFVCDSDFFRIKWDGDRTDPFKRIIPSSCKFTVLMSPTLPNHELLQTFYNDMVTSQEGRFYIRIIRLLDLGSETVFLGKVLPDVGDMVLDYIEDFTVTAIDGLTDLKNIEYRPTNYSDQVSEFAIQTISFKDHFLDILKRSDVVTYFNDSIGWGNTVLFTTSANWTESKYDGSGDIFKQVRVRNYWFEQRTPTYRKYQNCYDVLMDLMAGFNARIYCSKGVYHIEQLGYQDNPDPVIYGYDFDGESGGYYEDKVQHNYDATDTLKASRGVSARRLPTFKAIELTQPGDFTNYINGMDIRWPGNPGTHDLGPIVAEGVKVVASLNLDVEFGPKPFSIISFLSGVPSYQGTLYLDFEVTIKNGNFYLEPDEDLLNTTGYVEILPTASRYWDPVITAKWTLAANTIKVRYKLYESVNSPDFIKKAYDLFKDRLSSLDLVIESDDIQVNNENLFFTINNVQAYYVHVTGQITAASAETMDVRKTSRIIVGANGYKDLYEQPATTIRYEIGDIRNTLVYKMSLGYFDTPKLHFHQLFIKNSIYVTTAEPTTEWTDPDSATTLPIQNLVCRQMLAMRSYPNNTYNMSLFYTDDVPIYFRDVFAINGLLHIPIEMEMIASGPAGFTTYDTILWEVYKDYAGINIIDTGTPEPDRPLPFPTTPPDAASPGTIETYYEEWEGVTDEFVESVNNLAFYYSSAAPESVKSSTKVFVDGVKYKYKEIIGVPVPGDLLPNEYSINTDTNRLYFPFALESGYVELYYIKS